MSHFDLILIRLLRSSKQAIDKMCDTWEKLGELLFLDTPSMILEMLQMLTF